MATPQWTVSIIAQYIESDEDVVKGYRDLIESICTNTDPGICFYLLQHASTKVGEQTTFHSYLYDVNSKKRRHAEITIKNTQNFYESGHLITTFFKDYVAPSGAERHFVMLWGHGAGFGVFAEGDLREPPNNPQNCDGLDAEKLQLTGASIDWLTAGRNRLISAGIGVGDMNDKAIVPLVHFLSANAPLEKTVGKTGLKADDTFRIVSAGTIAAAIGEGFGKGTKNKKNVDVLMAMSCYMQLFETGYVLKEQVRYFAASETSQLFAGPDYKLLFQQLGSKYSAANADIAQLGNDLIKNYIDKYKNDPHNDSLFVSMNDLYLYKSFNRHLNELADHLIEHRATIYPIAQKARNKCTYMTPSDYGIIDLAHFCQQLLQETNGDDALNEKLLNVINAIKSGTRLIIAKKETPKLCPTLKPNGQSSCPNGLAIFFPKDKCSSSADQFVHWFMEKYYQPDSGNMQNFVTVSKWPYFVRDYYEYPFT